MTAGVKLRVAAITDIPALIELERTSPQAAHWTEAQYQEMFKAQGASPQRLVIVAEGVPGLTAKGPTDVVFAGFLVARHVETEWELENIAVAPSWRRRGVAVRLLDLWLAQAREAHSKALFLEVRESNAAARGLYEKVGFRQAGRRRQYYSHPAEDAVLYRYTLI